MIVFDLDDSSLKKKMNIHHQGLGATINKYGVTSAIHKNLMLIGCCDEDEFVPVAVVYAGHLLDQDIEELSLSLILFFLLKYGIHYVMKVNPNNICDRHVPGQLYLNMPITTIFNGLCETLGRIELVDNLDYAAFLFYRSYNAWAVSLCLDY